MKSRALFFALLIPTWGFSQHDAEKAYPKNFPEMDFGYSLAAPVGAMKHNIREGHGFFADYFIGSRNSRLLFGVDFSHSLYGYDKSRQEYTFDDGSVAPMDIIVNNSFLNLMAVSRYYLTERYGLKPYVSLRAGYSFFRTTLNIYDPDDTDYCEPIDSELLKKDGTIVVSGGGGLQWDLNRIFRRQPANTLLFNAGIALTLGGKVSYMNTDAPSHGHHHPDADITASFINTRTQVVHEHHVGYIYTSYVDLIEFRAGFVFRPLPLRLSY